jgi:hypothetical protein
MAAEDTTDVHWRLFQNLDLHSEKEQIELARFLDELVKAFGAGGKREDDQRGSMHALITDEDDDESASEEGSKSKMKKVQLDTSAPSIEGDISNFGPLPRGQITGDTALSIMEVFRRGGKLATKSVKKILRDTYKRLKVSF